jgi:integrase
MDDKATASKNRRRGHNEGSIYKRKDGRWVGVLTVGGLKRKSYYGRTRPVVQAKLTAAAAGLSGGVIPQTNERLTVGQFLTDWLSDTAQPSVRPSTFKGYEGKVRTHILPGLGTVRLVKLTPQNLEAFLNQKRAAGLSPQTVQHLRAILRAALSDAVRWSLVPRNVAALVDGPRVPHRDVRPLAPNEAQNLLEGVRTHRLGALFSVALAVGLRQGEALGLRWNDIDLDGGTLTVRKTLQRVDEKFVLVEPKTVRSRRTIALPSVAVNVLRTHRARQMEERLMAGALWEDDWGLVFTTATGRPLHGTNVTRTFQQLLAKSGLRHQRFHDLRHSCASLLLAQGVHPRVVMETLGHSQIALTMNTYSHVLPPLQREAAVRMDEVLAR